MGGGLDDRVDATHERGGDQQRANPVHSMPEPQALITRDDRLAERKRGQPYREVDEEHPVPAQGLGQQPPSEQPERAAGDGYEDIATHRPGPVARLRKFGDDDGEDHRGLGGSANSLQKARPDQRSLAGGDAAQQRRDREDGEATEEDALSTG